MALKPDATFLHRVGQRMGTALQEKLDQDASILFHYYHDVPVPEDCAACMAMLHHLEYPDPRCQGCQKQGIFPRFGRKGSRKPLRRLWH